MSVSSLIRVLIESSVEVADQTNSESKVSPSLHIFDTEPVPSDCKINVCSAVLPSSENVVYHVPTKSGLVEFEILSSSQLLQENRANTILNKNNFFIMYNFKSQIYLL